MVTEDLYDGIPVVELPVTDVDVPDPVHLRRSLRHPGELDIEPVAAIPAGRRIRDAYAAAEEGKESSDEPRR
jgi:hypothetical protein